MLKACDAPDAYRPEVHVVGDVVTPAKGDLLLASASGETASPVNVATKAKQLGGTVVLATIFPSPRWETG